MKKNSNRNIVNISCNNIFFFTIEQNKSLYRKKKIFKILEVLSWGYEQEQVLTQDRW